MNSVEWLTRLVAFDTTSCHSNLELIHFLSDEFIKNGINVRLTHDENKQKANLFATLAADDGSVNGGLVLSGHTDVVPVAGQQWDTGPFEATEKNQRIYGRGTCDMKGFIAVVMALFPQFQQIKLKQPLHFAFSYDEEVGCKGVRSLLLDLKQAGIKPNACIVGEPTDMRLVIAHKGINGFRCQVKGLAAHSSLVTSGCNAIEYAAQLIGYIRNLGEQFKQKGPFDECYDIPFTSMTTNLIQGGNALNIIPAECEFSFEFRNLAETTPKDVIDKIKAYAEDVLVPQMRIEYPNAFIEIHSTDVVPGFFATEDTDITRWVRELTDERGNHKVAYATEAGLFQQADIPTIICGPGSIEQAHRPNEFVEIDQLRQCEAFLLRLANHYLT
jgi:acetylornithine deacetylase